MESMLHTHDQISNRISFSIIIAALIIGSALIVISKTPPLFYGISLIGIIGFLAAAVMGIWLLVGDYPEGAVVVHLVCHAGGREFESRRSRHNIIKGSQEIVSPFFIPLIWPSPIVSLTSKSSNNGGVNVGIWDFLHEKG